MEILANVNPAGKTMKFNEAENCWELHGGEVIKLFWVKYLVEPSVESLNAAAKHGLIPIVKYLHHQGYYGNAKTVGIAASNGHLNLMKYLHRSHPEIYFTREILDKSEYVKLAANHGHTQVVQFMVDLEFKCDFDLDQIAENGHVPMMSWLYENGRRANDSAIVRAKKANQPSMLRFLFEKGLRWIR
jgi:hypothetical protein